MLPGNSLVKFREIPGCRPYRAWEPRPYENGRYGTSSWSERSTYEPKAMFERIAGGARCTAYRAGVFKGWCAVHTLQ